MLRKVTFIMVALSISACAYAVEFNDGGIHVIYDFQIPDDVIVDRTQDRQPGTHVFFGDGAEGDFGIKVYHHGEVTFYGGYTEMALKAYDNAAVTIQGGFLYSLHCMGNSRAVVTGGELVDINTHDAVLVVIRGQDFTLDDEPIDYGEVVLKHRYIDYFYYGQLKGNLPGNPLFDVVCRSYSDSGPNSRIFVLPADNCPRADLNNDCKVTFHDLAILASEWLACGYVDTSLCD